MEYYFNTTIECSFEEAVDKITAALKTEGFGVLTDIDVKATLKKKLDVNFREYRILGACNPVFAHKALTAEDKIGVFLPCSVIVQDLGEGKVEIAAVDPIASMMSVKNDALGGVATEVRAKLKKVIDGL